VKAGVVSLVGRPNAGKSTLLNRMVGEKVAIVSDKPQTTRTRVVGVKHHPEGQIVFVDTPGVHKPTHRMNVRMIDVALAAMRDVDVLTLVVDASAPPGPGDRYLLKLLRDVRTPAILALNKVDLVEKPSKSSTMRPIAPVGAPSAESAKPRSMPSSRKRPSPRFMNRLHGCRSLATRRSCQPSRSTSLMIAAYEHSALPSSSPAALVASVKLPRPSFV
jgi:small GTP-binding protein